MTKDNYHKAKDIMSEISKIDTKLANLYNSELTVNSESESRVWTLYNVEISKNHLQTIIKYNREVLNNQKRCLEQNLRNI
jgi:hypothetical protein